MNKKGLVGSSFIGGLIGLFFLLIFVIILLGFQNGVENPDNTINTFNDMQIKYHIQFNADNINSTTYNNTMTYSLIKIVYSFVDFTLYSTFEVCKLVIKFAYENQDIVNPQVLLYLILISLIAPIIYPVFIICVSIFLIIKEWRANKKEKKEMEVKKHGKGKV